MGDTATLDQRRRDGLCATCAKPLTERERALEGVGGSYVNCDACVGSENTHRGLPLTTGEGNTAEARDLAEQTLDGTLPYEETWRENAEALLAALDRPEALALHEIAAMRRSVSLIEALAESYPAGLERGDLTVTAEALRKLTAVEEADDD